jgi:Uncharacterized MobA-related protein
MNTRRVETGVVILAAGLSSRFGGRPKALAVSGGRSLLQVVVDKSRLAGIDQIKVVTGHHKAEIEDAARVLGVETIHNEDYEQGMFSSVKAGVRAMAGTESFFVWPVDAALTHVQTILTLIAAWNKTGKSGEGPAVMVPVFNSLTGHPPLFSARCLDDIAAWPGNGGLRGWIGSLMNEPSAQALFVGMRPEHSDGTVSFVNVPDEGVTSDIDTLEDLAAARQPKGASRPNPDEAWQLLLQHNPGRDKIAHCRLVSIAAFRLALALREAGRPADPDLALLGGLLHDIASGHKQHDQRGMTIAQNMGWPEIGRVIGAHNDPPAEVWRAFFDPDPGLGRCPASLAEACLSVYLADKYCLGDRPVTLKTRFEVSRHRFQDDPNALAAVTRREQTAVTVEDWFRRRLDAEPLEVAKRATRDIREEALGRLE